MIIQGYGTHRATGRHEGECCSKCQTIMTEMVSLWLCPDCGEVTVKKLQPFDNANDEIFLPINRKS